MFDITDIDESIQGSSGIMPTTRKGKLHVNVWQVYVTEWVCTLWSVKFCPKAWANLFSLVCEHFQRNNISSDCQNNIMVSSMNSNIIFDCWIKSHDDWLAGVKFLQETSDKMAQSATALCKKNINNLHVELKHPSKSITYVTAKTLGIQVSGTFKPCEGCTLGIVKQQAKSKKAVSHSKILGKRFFFNISSLSTPLLAVCDTGYSF